MEKHRKRAGVARAAMIAAALTALAFAGNASADDYDVFEFCPSKTAEVAKCLHALTTGGEVVLGNKKVPIEKSVTLQGGISKPVSKISKFFAATNGITLSKAPQSVPGGLAGIVPSASSPPLVKALIKFFFENSITGVNSTLELAQSASEIRVSETNIARKEGVGMKLPVKVHLENPFLGKNCYVGSSSSPIIWELTTGPTSPPKPNESISGSSGEIEFLDEGRILRLNNNELVDNAWAAPAATGCGGILGFLVNPIINAQVGLPSAAGKNTAILKNTVNTATVAAVNKH